VFSKSADRSGGPPYLPEVLLEVFSWTGAEHAFTSITGGEARLKDLNVTIAALLVAHSCNVGYTPVIGSADALKYGRLSHVDQTYLRLATYRTANATLIEHQAVIGLAQAWGGGLVASVECGSLSPSVYARPYFGHRGGATWLNMINDQAAGLGGKVVAGIPRDSLYVLDVLYNRDCGKRPDRAPMGGHPADHRLHPHWRRPRVRRHPDAVAGRAADPLGDVIAHYGRIAKSLHTCVWPTSPATGARSSLPVPKPQRPRTRLAYSAK
jgi:hypothetical protein